MEIERQCVILLKSNNVIYMFVISVRLLQQVGLVLYWQGIDSDIFGQTLQITLSHFTQFIIISFIFKMIAEFYSCVCCQSRPVFPDPYSFCFGKEAVEGNSKLFQSNEIKTTKYNVINFLPKSIISQYQRLANLYFLIVAIISTIPDVTPLNPAFIWTPLTIVLLISILKQMYEDYSRYKTDREVNDVKQVTVYREGKLQQIRWKNIVVGDLCLIREEEMFPADLLLISTQNGAGAAFIETASLDGEQTSKARYAFEELNTLYHDENQIQFQGRYEGDMPNPSLTQFKGTLVLKDNVKLAITDCSQLLFRGAKLKNTKWVWGLVVYTGQCSKIMMNGQNYVTKLSSVEKRLNYLLIFLFICQIVLCLVCASLSTENEISMREGLKYTISRNYGKGRLLVLNFLMFFVEYSSLIPVSLIVTIEIAKTVQSYFIDFDQLMYSSWRKKKVYARTPNLNEQLGQVQYVFCDKTGTLTKNQLKFHTAIIGNKSFTFEYRPSSKSYHCHVLQTLLSINQMQSSFEEQQAPLNNHEDNYHNIIDQYMMCLLVCNNCNIVKGKNQELIYESESPDELALMEMAKSFHYKLISREKDSILVEIQGKVQKISVVARFNFTSERKRMSIMMRWKGQFYLYSKGADNVMMERARDKPDHMDSHIKRMSEEGLRSLVIAVRVIPEREVNQFLEKLRLADPASRQSVMGFYADRFEKQLSVLGATGLLDELQNEVASTLRDFQRAGTDGIIIDIRVWMLTGDKLETAKQVGRTCGLIEPDYQEILLTSSCLSIENFIIETQTILGKTIKKYCLLVEGSVLSQIFNNQFLQASFARLTLAFSSVICCRMLPVQKSQAVRMIKRHLNKICLAVGDGGNDVSMIKEANIGIGVYGQQGMNAVQACDYAIPEFKMLWRLMFVHGRWNYMRICEMILYFCYKSIIFTVPRIMFSFYNGYSGQPIYDDFYIALYNIVFTSLPLLIRALFEQDVNYVRKKQRNQQESVDNTEELTETKHLPSGFTINYGLRKLFPKIYFVGMQNHMFNLKQCFLWISEPIVMSLALYYLVKRVLSSPSLVQDGYNGNLHIVSVTVFTSIMIVGTLKLCMQVRHWTFLLFFTILFLSLAPYFGFMWLVNYKFRRPVEGILYIYFTSVKTYFSILLLVLILVGINSILMYIRFHSHKILKKMTIALQYDEEIRSYISHRKEGSTNGKLQSNQMIRMKAEQGGCRIVEKEYIVRITPKNKQQGQKEFE